MWARHASPLRIGGLSACALHANRENPPSVIDADRTVEFNAVGVKAQCFEHFVLFVVTSS